MKTKKITKIITILFFIVMILGAVNMVFAGQTPAIPTGTKPSGADQVGNIAGMVIYIIQIIAFAAGVIMLVFLGIKFVTASPEGKAEVKKSAIIYVVGAILLFAAGGILTIVQSISGSINDEAQKAK